LIRKGRSQAIPIYRRLDHIPKRPRKLHKKPPTLHKHIQQGSKIQDQFTKISTFTYSNNDQSELECKKTILFTLALKWNKIPGNKLVTGNKVLCHENYNHWMKKLKKITEDGKISHAHELAESILWRWLYYQKWSTCSIQSPP
jgi:hypothetical protein